MLPLGAHDEEISALPLLPSLSSENNDENVRGLLGNIIIIRYICKDMKKETLQNASLHIGISIKPREAQNE